MPRKSKTNLTDDNAKNKILKEIYDDTFNIKTTSINILRNISKNINYENKEEVITILPLVQKQMDIIIKANDTLFEINNRINEEL